MNQVSCFCWLHHDDDSSDVDDDSDHDEITFIGRRWHNEEPEEESEQQLQQHHHKPSLPSSSSMSHHHDQHHRRVIRVIIVDAIIVMSAIIFCIFLESRMITCTTRTTSQSIALLEAARKNKIRNDKVAVPAHRPCRLPLQTLRWLWLLNPRPNSWACSTSRDLRRPRSSKWEVVRHHSIESGACLMATSGTGQICSTTILTIPKTRSDHVRSALKTCKCMAHT